MSLGFFVNTERDLNLMCSGVVIMETISSCEANVLLVNLVASFIHCWVEMDISEDEDI